MELNHAIFAKEKEMRRKLVITINVLSGVSGHLGPNVQSLVATGKGQDQELVMDLHLDFLLKGKFVICYCTFTYYFNKSKIDWWRSALSWSSRGKRKV